MAKPDIADMLKSRARLTAHALARADGPPPRGWQDYDWHEDLKVVSFHAGPDGFNIDYARNSDHRQRISFHNVRPLGELRNENVDIIGTGPVEVIDGATIPLPNFDAFTPMRVTYTPDFREARRVNDVRLLGFTQSLSLALEFAQGSEAAQFKAKQTITASFESRQEQTTERETTKEKGRAVEFPAEVPAGVEGAYWCTMKVQPKAVHTTGICDVTMGIGIGTRKTGKGGRILSKWQAHHDKYKRHAYYADWWEHFLPLIKADGGQRDWDCWQWFRDHPAPEWLTDRLEEPLALPFDHTSPPYDGHVSIEPHKRIIRVNEAINPELHAKWLANMAAAVE